ncbi:hypothetical protein [Mycolicibacterium wolinskyi]|nr:hypothetical protein [Mycolicibacterium wolinskyi]
MDTDLPPQDGVHYLTDDLREHRIYCALGLDWTPEAAARDDAAAEQVDAAMRDAERWDSRHDYPELRAANETIRRVTGAVVAAHRALGSSMLWNNVVDPVGARGDARPFDFDDAHAYVGAVLGLWAGAAHKVHILRADYTPAKWLASMGSGGCDWTAPLAKPWRGDCFGYATNALVFARGQYVVAMRTCASCFGWLVAGAPLPARHR